MSYLSSMTYGFCFTFLIHSANPKSRPVGIIVFAYVIRTSVPTFQNLGKQTKFQAKAMFTTGGTVGLAEWIIDDIRLVFIFVRDISYHKLSQVIANQHFNKDIIHIEEVCSMT